MVMLAMSGNPDTTLIKQPEDEVLEDKVIVADTANKLGIDKKTIDFNDALNNYKLKMQQPNSNTAKETTIETTQYKPFQGWMNYENDRVNTVFTLKTSQDVGPFNIEAGVDTRDGQSGKIITESLGVKAKNLYGLSLNGVKSNLFNGSWESRISIKPGDLELALGYGNIDGKIFHLSAGYDNKDLGFGGTLSLLLTDGQLFYEKKEVLGSIYKITPPSTVLPNVFEAAYSRNKYAVLLAKYADPDNTRGTTLGYRLKVSYDAITGSFNILVDGSTSSALSLRQVQEMGDQDLNHGWEALPPLQKYTPLTRTRQLVGVDTPYLGKGLNFRLTTKGKSNQDMLENVEGEIMYAKERFFASTYFDKKGPKGLRFGLRKEKMTASATYFLNTGSVGLQFQTTF